MSAVSVAARLPGERAEGKIQPWHRDRLAVVYVRQSTPAQVQDHGESTRLQYGLAGRAAALGWAPSRVLVIDEDLGHSASGADARPGFSGPRVAHSEEPDPTKTGSPGPAPGWGLPGCCSGSVPVIPGGPVTRRPFGRIPRLAVAAALVTAGTVAGSWPAAASTSATLATSAGQRGLSPGSRIFVPPPSDGAPQQILKLLKSGDRKDAALLTEMEATSRAVWFTSGTPAQVGWQVRQTMTEAAVERAVPVLVAYDVPGRDCVQYSAGGALSQADYQAWISGLAQGIGTGRAAVILEPDALGNLPSNCGLPASSYPFTDTERIAELQYAVGALERDPGVSVYLDGTHSAWQSVGTMTQRLLQAGVQQAQGFFVNVSNYQPTAELLDYGTWIDGVGSVPVRSAVGYRRPGGQRLIRPAGAPAGPASQPAIAGGLTQGLTQDLATALLTRFGPSYSPSGIPESASIASSSAPFFLACSTS